LLTEFCQRAGTSLFEAGQKTGIKGTGTMSKATSPQRNGLRRSLLSVEEIRRLAAQLDCNPEETTRLLVLGSLEYAPEILGVYVARIERDLERCRLAAGKPKPRYVISQ
jgi:hypothetical protein